MPDALGVPLIPPEVESANPVGNCPETTLQVYGGVPPLADIVAEYGEFIVPSGSAPVVSAIGVGAGAGAAATARE